MRISYSSSIARRVIARTAAAPAAAFPRAAPAATFLAPAAALRPDIAVVGGIVPPASMLAVRQVRTAASGSASFSSPAPSGADIVSALSRSDPGREFAGKDVEGAMEALANADAVAFDVDSTVIVEEGIDVLADSLGKGEEVAAWTTKAMEGDTKFEDALAARLDIIRPSESDIQGCLDNHPLHLSPGIADLIEKLNERGTDVFLVSGGFRIMIEPLARELCVSRANIFANTILFDPDGNYAGFSEDEPTSRDMGKPEALRRIKEKYGYDVMVMVGDGATDMQAAPPADAFIGYGGVAVRDAVRDGASWFVTDFHDVIEVVEKFGKSKLNEGPRNTAL